MLTPIPETSGGDSRRGSGRVLSCFSLGLQRAGLRCGFGPTALTKRPSASTLVTLWNGHPRMPTPHPENTVAWLSWREAVLYRRVESVETDVQPALSGGGRYG